jgi:tyrosyl-tRNA synthetase
MNLIKGKQQSREEIVDGIINRGVIVDVLPNKQQFRAGLISTKPLKIYIGADPTSSSLHLSHAKNYQLLEEIRQLGHEVFVLFGDFTARIGDPSGQSLKRKQLSQAEVKINVQGWMNQIKPLMDFDSDVNPPKVVYNYDWLSKLSMEELIDLASQFTVQQMIERDMFAKRLKENKPIHLHEFLYPLLQGYDSVAIDVDAELCGTDQIFNAMVGRQLQKTIHKKEKFVVAVNLMENPKTGELMSKSRGTGVFLDASPFDMYGAIMAQPDEMIKIFFVNNTRIPLKEIDDLLKNKPPRDAKMAVAREITKIFHGDAAATSAENQFVSTFKEGAIPEDAVKVSIIKEEKLVDILLREKVVSSKGDFRRLIDGNAVSYVGGESIFDPDYKVEKPGTIRVGKKRFITISVG